MPDNGPVWLTHVTEFTQKYGLSGASVNILRSCIEDSTCLCVSMCFFSAVSFFFFFQIEPPPHSVFPAEEACEVVRKLCQSEIEGRAILRFHSVNWNTSIFQILILGFSLQHAESWQHASSRIVSSKFGEEPGCVVEASYYIAFFANKDQVFQGMQYSNVSK